jgi:hypothetical protein
MLDEHRASVELDGGDDVDPARAIVKYVSPAKRRSADAQALRRTGAAFRPSAARTLMARPYAPHRARFFAVRERRDEGSTDGWSR